MTTAILHFDGWAGITEHPVELLGECCRGKDKGVPQHYKVRLLEKAYRYSAGQILYPPKWAVTDIKEGEKDGRN